MSNTNLMKDVVSEGNLKPFNLPLDASFDCVFRKVELE